MDRPLTPAEYSMVADCANASGICRAAHDLIKQGKREDALSLLRSHSTRADLGRISRTAAAGMLEELEGK